MPKYTLQLRRPFGKTLVLAVFFLLLLLGLAEMAARTHFFQSILPAPVIASGHRRLDLKLAFLDNLVEKKGHVDCIFLGSSMVHRAIDPEIFRRAYKAHTGKDIICFNFGVSGFIPPAAAIMAGILTKKYQPKLLIWGLSPATFGSTLKNKMRKLLTTNPWIQYRLGNYNFAGLLTEHSYAYRYYLRFRIWLERPEYSKVLMERESSLSGFGFPNSRKKAAAFTADPDRVSISRKQLRRFKKTKEATAALEQILQLHPRFQIVIVEIPVHPTTLSLYGKGAKVHYRTTAYISRRAKSHGILFIPSAHLNLIADEGWQDINHLNPPGARIFNRWLGEQVGKAVKKGLIKNL